MLALFTSVPLASFRAQLVLVVMMISHVTIDVGKATLIWRNSDNDGPPLFLLDQALHIMIVLIGGTWLVPCFSGLSLAIDRASQSVPEALVIAAVYIVVVFASAHLIRFLLGPLAQKLDSDETSDIKGLEDAGKYIGWLERFLVLTVVVSGSPTAGGTDHRRKIDISLP